jgi:hypothetical protein
MIPLALLKARIFGALTGVAAQALMVVAIVATLALGLWWLRHDARMDERASCTADMNNAEIADLRQSLGKLRESEALALKEREAWERSLMESEGARQSLMEALQVRKVRVIVYPKAIVRALNK